jgi:lactate permease
MQALIIGWVFATFLQGVGGFGVPVAVIAPILVGLGFGPMAAVMIPSIGHGWAVTFGSLGSSFQALIASTGLSWEQLVGASALFLGIAGVVSVGWWRTPSATRQCGGFWVVLALGTIMAVTQLIVARSGLWNIGAFIAGIASLLVGIPLAGAHATTRITAGWTPALLVAISGYGAMIMIILAVQLSLP